MGEDKRWFLELAQFNFNPYRIKSNINIPIIRPNLHSFSSFKHYFFNQFSPNLDPNHHDNDPHTIYQTTMATVRPSEMTVKKGPVATTLFQVVGLKIWPQTSPTSYGVFMDKILIVDGCFATLANSCSKLTPKMV